MTAGRPTRAFAWLGSIGVFFGGALALGAACGFEKLTYAPADAAGVDASGSDTACAPPAGQKCTTTFPVCGCAPTENCVFANDVPTCRAAGKSELHQVCDPNASDCAPGFFCAAFQVSGEAGSSAASQGICLQYCQAEGDCRPQRLQAWRCEKVNENLSVKGCLLRCDPRDETACSPNGMCVPRSYERGAETFCAVAGTVKRVGACASIFDCAPGWFCADGKCFQWCTVNGNDCPAGRSCERFSGPGPMVGSDELGACSPR